MDRSLALPFPDPSPKLGALAWLFLTSGSEFRKACPSPGGAREAPRESHEDIGATEQKDRDENGKIHRIFLLIDIFPAARGIGPGMLEAST
jgi:hypothetical protein